MQTKKRWWKSKTIWANLLIAGGVLVQALTGEMWLDAEAQGAIIVLINLILRIVTKTGLSA